MYLVEILRKTSHKFQTSLFQGHQTTKVIFKFSIAKRMFRSLNKIKANCLSINIIILVIVSI